MMDFDLEYDYEEALKRQEIDAKDVDLLRLAVADIDVIPKTMTNKQLLLFLDSNNKKIDEAKKVMKLYYETRKNSPEHFGNRDPKSKEVQQCLQHQDYFFLKNTSVHGSSIIFHRVSSKKCGDYHIDEAIRTFFMTIDSCLNSQGPRPSIIFLFDMTNVSLSHLTRVKIGSVKKFFFYLQECLPAKLNSIHIFNTVSFFDTILTLMKPFMKAEILKNLHLHTNNLDKEKFYEDVISLDNLPSDFGGGLDSVADLHSIHCKELFRLRDFFILEKRQRSIDEPEKEINKKATANIDSIRNLCID